VPVELTSRAASARPYAGALRADSLALLRILDLEGYELSLMLVGDRTMRRLNREFRGIDRATDVLSFPQIKRVRKRTPGRGAATAGAPPIALGDIVISIDTARRQASELGHRTAARIRTLLIHGMLHLQGYDHERSPAAARRMFAREHELATMMDAARPSARRQPARAVAKDGKFAGSRWSPAAMPAPPQDKL
jgi:rRNA maturation RNase YbeY